MRVLVAAGREDLEKALCSLCEKRSYDMQVARHLEAVIEANQMFQPDLVMLNPFMPGKIHTVDLIRELRLSETSPRILLFIGSLEEKVLQRITRYGVYDFIANPIHLQDVVDKIDHPSTIYDVKEYLDEEEKMGLSTAHQEIIFADELEVEDESSSNSELNIKEKVKGTIKKTLSTITEEIIKDHPKEEEETYTLGEEEKEDGDLESSGSSSDRWHKNGRSYNGKSERRKKPFTHPLPHVIAVGGPSGCGASFFAWNLATVLNAVLMDARPSGALAKWLKIEQNGTRQAYLSKKLATKYAVTADEPMDENELMQLARINETVVVDVGNHFGNVWEAAGRKVYVITPDPQFENIHLPDAVIRVLNRYPEAFPISPEKCVNARIDLTIPDQARDVFLSLMAGVPWITRQPESVVEKWRAIFSVPKEASKWQYQ